MRAYSATHRTVMSSSLCYKVNGSGLPGPVSLFFGLEIAAVPSAPRGRSAKPWEEKHQATSIRLHPKVMTWARREAPERGLGYQTVISEVWLEKAG